MKQFYLLKHRVFGCLAAGVMLGASPVSALNTPVFDAHGFESPGYAPGGLAGQDTWQTTGGGFSAATVQGSVVSGGSQALIITRAASSNDRWAPLFTELTAPDSVLIEWDMRIADAGNPGFGPYFGVEMYDDSGAGSSAGLLGAFFVDSATGDLLFDDAGGFGVTGQSTGFDQWNTYSVLLDFQAGTYTLGFNGSTLQSVPFSDGAGLTQFTAFEFIALGDQDSPAASGTAYFDNLVITQEVAALPADLDGDGDVDDADFGLFFAAFSGPGIPTGNPSADLDNDNDTDDADFGLAFAAFTGPGGAAAVPEPASLALLLGLGTLCLRRCRRQLAEICAIGA